MKRKNFLLAICLVSALSFVGCGQKEEEPVQVEETVAEPVQEVAEEVVEEPEEPGIVEPQGKITSSLAAIDGDTMYYAYNGNIYTRNMETGEESEYITTEDNGITNFCIYDGYIYATWDKYSGSDDNIYEIYRFSLEEHTKEKLADGCMPLAANRNVYYWDIQWKEEDNDWSDCYLYSYNVDTAEITEVGKFGALANGINDGYTYGGIYEYFYQDGEIYIEISYEELGDYVDGMYLWKEDAKRGVVLYDLAGNVIDQSGFDIEYLSYYDDASKYGVDSISEKTDIVGGGKIVTGEKNGKEVFNYIDPDGNVTQLRESVLAG